jgi:hypothetical protein
MTQTKARTCAYPGCEVIPEADPERGGPPPSYCASPEHNAHSAFHAIQRGEGDGPAGGAAGLGPGQGVDDG